MDSEKKLPLYSLCVSADPPYAICSHCGREFDNKNKDDFTWHYENCWKPAGSNLREDYFPK